MVTFSPDTNPEIDIARSLGHRRADVLLPDPLRRRRRRAAPSSRRPWPSRPAWPTWSSATGRSTSARGTGSVPASRAGPRCPTPRTRHFSWYPPVGLLTPAQWVAMAAQRYLHVTGATTEDLGRVAVADRTARRQQPQGLVLREADHPGGPPGVAGGSSSRCACSTAARRPTGARRSSSPRSSGPGTCRAAPAVIEAAAQGSGPGQEMMTSYYCDDLLGLPEMASVGPPAVADVGSVAGRHPDRGALRPLHPVRALPAGGARVLRQGRGQGLRAGRQHRDRRGAAHQHARRPARRGLPPRHERDRRRGPPGPGHTRTTRCPTWSTCWSPPAPGCPPAV